MAVDLDFSGIYGSEVFSQIWLRICIIYLHLTEDMCFLGIYSCGSGVHDCENMLFSNILLRIRVFPVFVAAELVLKKEMLCSFDC